MMTLAGSSYRERDRHRAYEAFLQNYPRYEETARLDHLREQEYRRLDATGQIYLDYTGGGLYADGQVQRHLEQLRRQVFGNPHSINPTSLASTELVERARAYVLAFFNAPPGEYVAIFTPNASGALKLVGESYPFEPGSRYLLTADNHNSVNGIREFARARGARVQTLSLHYPELRLAAETLPALLDAADRSHPNLFAFPAQSNFSGAQHPLEMIAMAQERGWHVLLDAAAFAPTNRLDLARWRPDFVPLSFYKMFGYPTGLGCLLARKSALARLRRPWFAGGTILIASVQGNGYFFAEDEAAFEDGTVDYLNIPAIEIGLRHLDDVGLDAIHERVRCLSGWLLENLGRLQHGNGRPMVELYGPRGTEKRGGTVTFNLLDSQGQVIDIGRVEEMATAEGISLRTGCFCNPGAGEVAAQLSPEELHAFFDGGHPLSFQELRDAFRQRYGKEIGAIRVSVGLVSNFPDVYRLLQFLASLRDCSAAAVGRADAGCRPRRDSA